MARTGPALSWCRCGLPSAAVVRQAQAATEAGSAALRGRGARAANLLKYKERYLLLIPALVLFLVFRYVPMAGIVLAWKQFTVTGGLFGTPWAGWKFFERLFASPDFFRVLRNTLFINGVLRMGNGHRVLQVVNLRFKRVVQTISYLPHFLSWVVVASLIRPLVASSGPLNLLAAALGLETPILFLQRPGTFLAIVLVSDIRKEVGWGSIIYLAAISGIDPSLYESAEIDGAGRIQQMRFITLPSITFVIVIMFLLQLGNILELGFASEVLGIAYFNSVFKSTVGTAIILLVSFTAAFGLADRTLPGIRTLTFFMVFTMFFSGGLIPTCLWYKQLGLLDTRIAWLLHLAANAFYIIIMRNFFREIPAELTESATIDGASLLQVLFRIIVPLAAPVVATVALWAAVAHWNDWFFPLIFTPEKRLSVLQVLLRRVLLENQDTTQMEILPEDEIWMITPEPLKAALLFVSVGPIVAVYPFLQRYFVKGIMLGSVKG